MIKRTDQFDLDIFFSRTTVCLFFVWGMFTREILVQIKPKSVKEIVVKSLHQKL